MTCAVYLCSGSGCRKKLSRRDLEQALEPTTEIITVGCQKVCRGPVVGTDAGGRLEWFSRMDSDKALRALSRAIESDRLGKSLEKRRSKKRSGKLRS